MPKDRLKELQESFSQRPSKEKYTRETLLSTEILLQQLSNWSANCPRLSIALCLRF